MIIEGNDMASGYPCILSADHFNRSISADENVHD